MQVFGRIECIIVCLQDRVIVLATKEVNLMLYVVNMDNSKTLNLQLLSHIVLDTLLYVTGMYTCMFLFSSVS